MIKAVLCSAAVLLLSTTGYSAEGVTDVAKDDADTYTYVVGMSGVT